MEFLVQICPQGANPLKRFLQNLVQERESRIRTLGPNFIIMTFKMRAYSPKIAKMLIFGINFKA